MNKTEASRTAQAQPLNLALTHLTNDQAAEYLGVSPRTLDVWRSTLRYPIPYIKIGSRVRYRREDLDAWMASRRVSKFSRVPA